MNDENEIFSKLKKYNLLNSERNRSGLRELTNRKTVSHECEPIKAVNKNFNDMNKDLIGMMNITYLR